MTHASLFSGIGGFDLAAEWMGWTNLFNCEWEEFPRQVLKHHFPNAIQHGDIKELDATAYAGRVDILTGGFPCQPYSVAGKRLGKEDERHLWPEMLRVIRECSPRWVVGENVRGIVNWNGGLVFEEVCADLETCGYSVQPFVLPAAGVASCPHRRDRVWFVAHSLGAATGNQSGKACEQGRRTCENRAEGIRQAHGKAMSGGLATASSDGFVAYADDKGRSNGHRQVQGAHGEVRQRDDRTEPCHASGGDASDTSSERYTRASKRGKARDQNREDAKLRETTTKHCTRHMWERFPTVSPVCGGDDGLPTQLDGLTFSKWRRESIKAYGNAIVPQVALQIFKAIQAHEDGTRI